MAPGSGLATILFTDLVNSTDLLARAGDEDAQRIFRAHHELLAEEAAAHQGEEVKWLGDGLMVAFASAADAVQCAIAMQHNARRAVRGERLTIRVGINAGETLREEADYFGLPVVVARRLCDRADAGQILCTDVVAGLLIGRPDFSFSDLGTLELKGVPRPVRAFAVGCEQEGPAVIPSRMPFVGRQAELDRLEHSWAEARAGRGGLVLLAGEPGIGKTRLAEEIAEQAARDGAEVLWGHCFEGEWMPPYAPFAEVVEAMVLGVDADELRVDLGGGGPPLAQLVPALRKAVPEIPEPTALQPPEERFRLFDALARLLQARAERAPVLLCLDDLHWADRGSIDAFHHIARQLRRDRILVLGTYRDAEVGRDAALTDALGSLRRETEYERVVLAGLSAGAVGTLLDALAEQDVSEATATVLAAETDGNPFFLREVLRHLIEEGQLYRGADGRWTSEVPMGELGLPEGVRDVVGRRLARLSPAANRLVAAASLFEGSFRLGLIAAASGLGEDGALDALDETLAAQLVHTAGGADTYVFTHALIRQTVRAELSPSRRVRLHRQVAVALEREAGAAPDPAAAGEIAAQYHRSRELAGAERGADAALVAAAHAEGTGGQAEAAHFLRLALDLMPDGDPRRPRVLGRLGMALIWSFAFDDGLDVATLAGERIAATDGPGAAAEYLAGAALVMGVTGNNPRAWALAQQGLGHTGDRRDLAWARLTVLDFQRREWGDPEHPGIALDTPERWEAARILQSSNPDPVSIGLLEAPFADRTEALARSGNISVLVCYAGEFAGALPLAEVAAEESLNRGQMIRAARSFMVAAFAQLSMGNLAEGRAALEEAERLAAPAARRSSGSATPASA